MKSAEHKSAAISTIQKKSNTPFFDTEHASEQESPFFAPQEASGTDAFFQPATRPIIQTKLTVGQPNDKYEQEADNVADKVVQRLAKSDESNHPSPIAHRPLSTPSFIPSGVSEASTPIIQHKTDAPEEEKLDRKEDNKEELPELQKSPVSAVGDDAGLQMKCAACEAEEDSGHVQMKGNTEGVASSNIESQLNSSKGGGSPLPNETRTSMESAMGADFSNVRVHTGSNAVQMSQNLNAQAFTHGSDVYFNEGKYNPSGTEGGRLLAHELVHTVQQGNGSIQRKEAQANLPINEPEQARFIIDDTVAPQEGQMQKSDFLKRLNEEVCLTVNQALQGTPFTSDNCPYLRSAFNRLQNKTPLQLEQIIQRYEPATRFAQDVNDLMQQIKIHVFAAATLWVQTGDISGLPEELSSQIPNNIRFGTLSSILNVSQRLSTVFDTISSGVGNLLSGVTGIFFKSKQGGVKESQSPLSVMQNLGKGNPIDSNTKGKMEGAFGTNFSDVEVHTDNKASSLADNMNARAFTVGNHVAFGSGEHQPGTLVGDALMAHELAHVEQQKGSQAAVMNKDTESDAYQSLESDADNTSVNVVSRLWGNSKDFTAASQTGLKTGLKIQRCSTGPDSYTKIGKTYAAKYSWSGDEFSVKIEQYMIQENISNQHLTLSIEYIGSNQSNRSRVTFQEVFYSDPGILSPVFQAENDGSLTIDVFKNGKYIVKISDSVFKDDSWTPPSQTHYFTANINGEQHDNGYYNPITIKPQDAIPSSFPKITEQITTDKKIYDPIIQHLRQCTGI